MTVTKALTVMVVSDLHATSAPPGDAAGSWITTTTPKDDSKHPLFALKNLITANDLDIDVVLCAGDIADKADAAALDAAWSDLNDIAAHAEAILIATAGNHDLDSRHSQAVDPRGFLYDLEPIFPTDRPEARADYWSKNYAIVDGQLIDDAFNWRVVTLNSSAFHGYTVDGSKELDHGRITERTTTRLAKELDARAPAKIQILMLHHHVQQLPDVDLADSSQVKDVEHLLSLLERTGPWLVIHGHKHRPFVFYAPGGGESPAVFSAASLAAFSSGQLSTAKAHNQVHVIHLATQDELDLVDLGLGARFESWTWLPNVGWRRSQGDSGLPGIGGFGWRLSPSSTARRFAKKLAEPAAAMTGAQLLELEPRLPYVSPSDQSQLISELNKNGIAVRLTSEGEIDEIRRKMVPPDLAGGDV